MTIHNKTLEQVAKEYVNQHWGEHPIHLDSEWKHSEGYNCYIAGAHFAYDLLRPIMEDQQKLIAEMDILVKNTIKEITRIVNEEKKVIK